MNFNKNEICGLQIKIIYFWKYVFHRIKWSVIIWMEILLIYFFSINTWNDLYVVIPGEGKHLIEMESLSFHTLDFHTSTCCIFQSKEGLNMTRLELGVKEASWKCRDLRVICDCFSSQSFEMPHDIVASEDRTVFVGDVHAKAVWKFASAESMLFLFLMS